MESADTDVVIIGGGVAGLWLLHSLRTAGLSVALVEVGALGGMQSGHSHVYIHRGHIYRGVMYEQFSQSSLGSFETELWLASTLWDLWLSRGELPDVGGAVAVHEAGIYGFTSEEQASATEALWATSGLSCEAALTPLGLQDSMLEAFRAVEARCLNATRLLTALSEGHKECLLGISKLERFEWDGDIVKAVIVRGLSTNRPIRLTCRVAILAAGSANKELLDLLEVGSVETVDRHSHMLVIRGPEPDLPRLTGVFGSPLELFIVSRLPTARETLWLVSDGNDEPDQDRWVPDVIYNLGLLAPRLFADKRSLQWGVYAGPKAEVIDSTEASGSARVGQSIPVLPNVWAVWPIKLTLAPLVAQRLTEHLVPRIRNPSSQPDMSTFGPAPDVAPEKWQGIALENWDRFSSRWSN